MAKAGKGSMQMDQRAKIKVIAASALLAIAVIWIIYYISSMGGPAKAGPSLSTAEQAVKEAEHEEEFKKVQQQSNEGYRGKKPPAPPSGS